MFSDEVTVVPCYRGREIIQTVLKNIYDLPLRSANIIFVYDPEVQISTIIDKRWID